MENMVQDDNLTVVNNKKVDGTNMGEQKKKRNLLFVVIAAIIVLLIANSAYKRYEDNRNQQRIVGELTRIAIEEGLDDFDFKLKYDSGYKWYNVDVYCSNFQSFSYAKMFAIDEHLNSVAGAYVHRYYSAGACYAVYIDSIYKDGKEIYDGYKKANSYQSTFTNKYGTATTKCNHVGCNNYIASSGDTNCCTTHSKKCGECGKYIDEDALYCIDCLLGALQ